MQDRVGRRVVHAVGPQVIDVPGLLEQRRWTAGARGALVEEDVREGGVHHHGCVARIDERDDVVAVGEAVGPHGDLALSVFVSCVDEVAPVANARVARGVLVDGYDRGIGVD